MRKKDESINLNAYAVPLRLNASSSEVSLRPRTVAKMLNSNSLHPLPIMIKTHRRANKITISAP